MPSSAFAEKAMVMARTVVIMYFFIFIIYYVALMSQVSEYAGAQNRLGSSSLGWKDLRWWTV